MVSVVVTIVSTNKYVLVCCMFMSGLAEVGRYHVGYIYIVEMLPKRIASFGGLYCFLCMAVVKINICFYFMIFEKKEWQALGYGALI